jgi:hypothetical protein
MAFSTVTITTVANTTATVTLTTSNSPSAKQFVQNLWKNGGVFDDAGVWFPVTAVLKAVIT